MAFGEIVEDRDRMAGFEKLLDANAADIAGAAGDEDVHESD